MSGVNIMNTREANIALLNTIPEEKQQQINVYLTKNYCNDSPFRPQSANEIYSELAKSEICYKNGDYEDFDGALDEISRKYDL